MASPPAPCGDRHPRPPPSPLYVLAADGSSVFLVDPRKPPGAQEPPPYASFSHPRHRARTLSARSAPAPAPARPDETTPLLHGHDAAPPAASRAPFWRPVATQAYWLAAAHLVLLNFPFALLVWPPLLVGTLAGTALLITLPLGAVVWWLTLFLARAAARLESIMQLYYHPSPSEPHYHPVFYRPVLPSFHSFHSPSHSSLHSPYHSPSDSQHFTPLPSPSIPDPNPHPHPHPNPQPPAWDKRFLKCSYAMFLDHYSYSALSYFLLIKPLITLFSTIIILASFPLALATVFGLPLWLRAVSRWGRWQAQVAVENL